LPNNYENIVVNSQTIYVKIENNNQCFSTSTVNLNVIYSPVLEADETIIYCTNIYPETITLYGGVLNDLPNNYYYQWYFNGILTNSDTTFNDINETGTYTVIVTDPNGCSTSRTIAVNPSESATIENVTIEGISPSNTVTIKTSGLGSYEYALDDINGLYQDSNVFHNIREGEHTIFVRDINGCEIVEQKISVLGFPKFFTPNGDSDNDTWRVIGTNTQSNQIESVQIFSRYGKLITEQKSLDESWDGTFNGQELPGDDYWYIAKFINGKRYVGHFALRR
jgi:gliding motility-associated-like protein